MKTSVAKSFVVVLAAGLALGASLTGALALECPALQSLDDSGAAPDLKGQLSSKDVLAQVPGIFGALQQKYPGASKPQLVNYLIAAYCPVVKDEGGLNDEEKMARIREFADKAISLAY